MPEINQYTFQNRELLEIVIRKAGISDGAWSLTATFGVTMGPMGPAPDQIAPGFAVVVQGVGIQRLPVGMQDPMALDASVVNPSPNKLLKSKRK